MALCCLYHVWDVIHAPCCSEPSVERSKACSQARPAARPPLRRGDANEAAFHAGLLEDRSAAGQSYVEYLCAVHRQIQAKLDA
jgi:hypothetical protein